MVDISKTIEIMGSLSNKSPEFVPIFTDVKNLVLFWIFFIMFIVLVIFAFHKNKE